MADWSDLETELDAWRQAGRTPQFWWRDDDCNAPTPALSRLLEISERHDVPLHLGVVPISVSPRLGETLAPHRHVFCLQHGFRHINHEPKGTGASEIGATRALDAQLGDLRAGWKRLTAAALPNLLPGLVPPWNRIAAKTAAALPGIGFNLLSAYDYPPGLPAVPGLLQVHIHLDPINWKQRAFGGEARLLDHLLTHLRARRSNPDHSDNPIGLLTHHLQCDEETWAFVDQLLSRLTRPGAGRWLTLPNLLETQRAAS